LTYPCPSVPIQPEDLNPSGLPRSTFGGVKEEAVADLLKRTAWDYREALARKKQLEAEVEQLTRRAEELEEQLAATQAKAAERRDPDELLLTVLGSAQRAAREQREEARREAELLLRKARVRARRIEDDAVRRADAERGELAAIEALRDEVADELRSLLESILALGREAPVADQVASLDGA